MSFDIRKIEDIPRRPGVYLMKDIRGRVIYVGKAKDLRARVRSYFRQAGNGRPGIRFLLQNLEDLAVVVTASEKEALLLENTFIKKHRPRYNVRFRDDKNYFQVRIDTTHPFPRLGLVRRPQRDGALYFGPYASSHAVRQTLRLLQRHMGLRTCKDSQLRQARRTCLNQQMGRCTGVCRGAVTQEEYEGRVQEAILFLQGRSKELLRRLEVRMKAAADGLRFEEAARIRDQTREVQRTIEGQRAVRPLGSDRDAIGLHRVGDKGVVLVLRVREGKVWESVPFPLQPTPLEDQEVLSSFLSQLYNEGRMPPREILIPQPLGEEARLLEEWLGELAGHRVKIRCPQRGEARQLLDMAEENAQWTRPDMEDVEDVLLTLARRLELRRVPRIVEGFDISTLGGEEAFGSAVRFVDGVPDRRSYRTYAIRGVQGIDDYAMMYELLRRHLRRRKEAEDLPDLLVLDGGKGQLAVGLAVREEIDLKGVDAVALAKGRGLEREGRAEEDRVFVPGRKDAISLRREPAALRILQHVRDEAHRFALAHHRRSRGRKRIASPLDIIPGVGPSRKRAILKHLGSMRRLREATIEELTAVPGIPTGVAQMIYTELSRDGKRNPESRSQKSE